MCPLIFLKSIELSILIFLCITDELYAVYVQKLHGLLKQKKIKLRVDFSRKFSKNECFLIERPKKNAYFYGLIKSNPSKAHLLGE